jgi:hypothetical protein
MRLVLTLEEEDRVGAHREEDNVLGGMRDRNGKVLACAGVGRVGDRQKGGEGRSTKSSGRKIMRLPNRTREAKKRTNNAVPGGKTLVDLVKGLLDRSRDVLLSRVVVHGLLGHVKRLLLELGLYA